MAPHQRIPMKPNSIKTRFTYGFLRTLKRLSKHRPTSSSSPKEIFQGYRMVKMAADASMASAVGSRRAWSQAMLWKIRCQARHGRHALGRRRRRSSSSCRRSGVGKKVEKELGLGQTDELRDLVPGGEAMDLYSLLGETAHYIKCLTTQVQIEDALKYRIHYGGWLAFEACQSGIIYTNWPLGISEIFPEV